MPEAVLASVVFLIGIELVDIAGMRKILALAADEFVVAAVTASSSWCVGVEQGIMLAIVLSLHRPPPPLLPPRRHACSRRTTGGRLPRASRVDAGDARTLAGLVVYRFAASLYYANANRFSEQILELVAGRGRRLTWLCIDAVGHRRHRLQRRRDHLDARCGELQDARRPARIAEVRPDVRAELDRYGITEAIGRGRILRHGAGCDRGVRGCRRPGGPREQLSQRQ